MTCRGLSCHQGRAPCKTPETCEEIGYEAARLNQLEGGNVINFAGDEPASKLAHAARWIGLSLVFAFVLAVSAGAFL